MIIQIQALCKILAKQDYSFIEDNLLTRDLFSGYEAEYDFIVDHYNNYGKIPDELTFREKFPDFEIVEVTETDRYIVDSLREAGLFIRAVSVFNTASDMMNKGDSNEAVQFLKSKLETDLQPQYSFDDSEILSSTRDRVRDSEYINQNKADWFIPTGFSEIDDEINGFQRGEELVVLFARTNQGKSWVLEAICTHMVEMGYTIGYFSPEMSDKAIGYRFDTLHGNLSNNAIRLGRFTDDFTLDDYSAYADKVDDLSGKFYVTKPKDFARNVTISKLRNWIKSRKLDVLAIDGITYLTDERYRKGDSKTISLTNISEDLMELSSEMKIPIIVVVQANRGGVVDKNSLDTPELENIRDSDGIAQNASIVYSVRQIRDKSENVFLLLENKKMRAGMMGSSYKYKWNIDKGEFESVQAEDIDIEKDESTAPKETRKSTYGKKSRQRNVEEEY